MDKHPRTNTIKLHRYLASLTLLSASLTASARCWQDDALTQIMWGVARQHFSTLLASMPRVEICSPEHFSNSQIGGQYVFGNRIIQVPTYGVNRDDLTRVLAHELGHAEAERRGIDDRSLQGHGVGWMRVMIEAGLGHEVQRVAGYMPGAAHALQLAQRQGNSGKQFADAGKTTFKCIAQVQLFVSDSNGQRVETYEIPGCIPR